MAYKWDPQEYSKSSAGQHRWAEELIHKLDLKGNEGILDIGCGDGCTSAEIAASVPLGFVVGLDSSREMIDYARKNFPLSRFPNLSFDVGDAGNLKYVGGFDVVFSNAALHWVKDHLPVLQGIKRSRHETEDARC